MKTLTCINCGSPLQNTDYYCGLACASQSIQRDFKEIQDRYSEVHRLPIESLELSFDRDEDYDNRQDEIAESLNLK